MQVTFHPWLRLVSVLHFVLAFRVRSPKNNRQSVTGGITTLRFRNAKGEIRVGVALLCKNKNSWRMEGVREGHIGWRLGINTVFYQNCFWSCSWRSCFPFFLLAHVSGRNYAAFPAFIISDIMVFSLCISHSTRILNVRHMFAVLFPILVISVFFVYIFALTVWLQPWATQSLSVS